MAEQNQLSVEVRTQFGKGFARRLRASGKIPAVLYGHGTDPVHIALPGHETALIVRQANALLSLDVAGDAQLALVKDVQRDPVRQIIEHIDLLIIRRGEKIVVDVPVVTTGEPFSGTVAAIDSNTLSLEVEATNIPENITIDVEGLEDGAQILAGDVSLPNGATLMTDPEALVVGVSIPREEPEEQAGEPVEGEAGQDAADGAAHSDASE